MNKYYSTGLRIGLKILLETRGCILCLYVFKNHEHVIFAMMMIAPISHDDDDCP